jgi:hypothetical protein
MAIMPTPSKNGSVALDVDDAFKNDGGDTWAIVADVQGVFHPVWIDRRTGIFQTWSAPIRVDVTP